MELGAKGDLKAFLETFKKEQNMSLGMDDKMAILRGICVGMKYLHNQDIIHRDLKLNNVVLTDTLVPKIMDFGLERFVFFTAVSHLFVLWVWVDRNGEG